MAAREARLAAVERFGHHPLTVEHLHLDVNTHELRGEGARDALERVWRHRAAGFARDRPARDQVPHDPGDRLDLPPLRGLVAAVLAAQGQCELLVSCRRRLDRTLQAVKHLCTEIVHSQYEYSLSECSLS